MTLCYKPDCESHTRRRNAGYLSVSLRLPRGASLSILYLSHLLWNPFSTPTYMPDVFHSVFTPLASMSLFILVSFWVFGKWNCPLMRIIYNDLGGESV